MKFLCLCHYDLTKFESLGPSDFEEIGRVCEPHDREFKESGRVAVVGSLGMPDQFKTLHAQDDGAFTVSDGPYAPTREPFGAFFIVEADSIEQAVEIARLHPGTHLGHIMAGGIEVRPIDHYEQL